ncbi:hypothetical protein CQW23_18311 [Capsicum baccatum]|uniref:Enoyl reductase (ER) domain-containing protein n=1 Tax=Capsicum baccatum TaxID=33114 RepID=A0A2G2WGA8_CAPBA|nr:hypothetical protein CQW23_18311 [Capsicum baccatum]
MSFSHFIRRAINGSTSRIALSARSTSSSIFASRSFCSEKKNSNASSTKTAASDASYYHLNDGPSHMRAAVFWEPGKPLTFEDFHMPRPKANEILLKTKACGVCHSDLHVIKGELPFASPCVVGHEITGEVIEHGQLSDSKITERFPVGSQVVGAFIMPCGSCSFCSKGQDDLCEDFFAYNRAKGTLYDGETRLFLRNSGKPVYMYSMGGLAEYCVVAAHALAVLPKSLPYTESAILGCAVFTAYGAMAHAAQVRPGDAIAVIGIGAIQLVQEITGGLGVDVAVEALGKPQTFLQCVQSVRDGGKAVMIGLAQSGAKGEVDINHLVRRQIKVIGSYGARARQDLPKLIKLAESGIFNLTAAVSRTCKFEEAPQAYRDLDKGAIAGRAIVEIM